MAGQGGWSTSLNGSGSNGSIVAADKPGYQFADRVRNDLLLLGGIRKVIPITMGSRKSYYRAAAADTYEDHQSYADFTIPWTDLKGDVGDTWTVEVIASCRCENASTTVTPRIVTAGTSTVNVTGAAHATTSWTAQTLPLVSGSGDVSYRLQFKQSDLLYDVQIEAEVRMYI
jgi:hypothetical protein